MNALFQRVETVATRGAEGLAAEARESLVRALQGTRCGDGGYAGLDGRSDPYYTLFAWLCLRALGAPYDRASICAYMKRCRPAGAADAWCARFLPAAERGGRFAQAWLLARVRGDTYGAFLGLLAARRPPRWLCRLAWRRLAPAFEGAAAAQQPTPRLAAAALLAESAGANPFAMKRALESRHRESGGFASASSAPSDLLATAVARFALARSGDDLAGRADLAFIETCWLDDGLFGACSEAIRGDSEYTFYGLLALGTCRGNQER